MINREEAQVSDERILGQLLEHVSYTNRRLEVIEKKIDELQSFRWRTIGSTVAISAVLSIVIQLMGK